MFLTVIALLLRLQLGEHLFSSLSLAPLGASLGAELLDYSACLFFEDPLHSGSDRIHPYEQ